MRCTKGTTDFRLYFLTNISGDLQGYADSDWVVSVHDTKSTSGYVFLFDSVVFSLSSKKQEMVSQSSVEAEYIFVVAVTNQIIWLRKILSNVGQFQNEVVVIWVDNKYGISITKNSVQLGRTRHIDVKYQSIREAEM